MNVEADRIIFGEASTIGIPDCAMAVLKVFPEEHIAHTLGAHAEPLRRGCIASDCGLDTVYAN